MGLIPGNSRRSLLNTRWDPATDNTPHHKTQRTILCDCSMAFLTADQGPTPKQLPLTTLWQQAELQEVEEAAQARRDDSCATRPNSCRHCSLVYKSSLQAFYISEKKTPKILRSLSYHCILLATTARGREATSVGTQCTGWQQEKQKTEEEKNNF